MFGKKSSTKAKDSSRAITKNESESATKATKSCSNTRSSAKTASKATKSCGSKNCG